MMDVRINNCDIDLKSPIDIAIPLDFAGPQPSYFGAPAATAVPLNTGTFTGDTRLGFSCNVEVLNMTPHCNGTHTECAGHIMHERMHVADLAPLPLLPASLITIKDSVITRQLLKDVLDQLDRDWLHSLVVRTNSDDPFKDYSTQRPVWFEPEAIRLLHSFGVDHLLTDLPSIDHPESSNLPGHHLFWDVDKDGQPVSENMMHRTITEMVFVPASTPDGNYALHLSWPRLKSDAAPSRPVLYPLSDVNHGS